MRKIPSKKISLSKGVHSALIAVLVIVAYHLWLSKLAIDPLIIQPLTIGILTAILNYLKHLDRR